MASPLLSSGFSDALVILGAAGLVIPAFARAKISPVIGFILVGLLVGPFGLGALVKSYPWLYHITISDPHAIEPFAEFGIVLLLFSIGLELSFKRLWSMRQLVFGTGAAQLIVSGIILGTGLHLALGLAWTGSMALGIALALSSTALVLPIAGTASPVGRTAFAMLLFEDLALVPIIFVLGALGPMAAAAGWSGFAKVGGLAVLAFTIPGTIAIVFMRLRPPIQILQTSNVALLIGLATILAAVQTDHPAFLVVGTIIAGLGHGTAFLGSLRCLLPLALPQERAGLLAALFVESYLAFSLPAMGAGFLSQKIGLVATTEIFVLAVFVLILFALVATHLFLRKTPLGTAGA
eukprot:gene22114-23164_t